MGDIWPYGPPRHTTTALVMARLAVVGFRGVDIDIGQAIAHAEGGLDLAVVNDTPATGDYSVGTFQINYYGSLYAERVHEFGTPQYMVVHGLDPQVYAARRLWLQSGWRPWSTYTSGAYRRYLTGKTTVPGGTPPPKPPPHDILPPTEDYSPTIVAATNHVQSLGDSFHAAALVLSRL